MYFYTEEQLKTILHFLKTDLDGLNGTQDKEELEVIAHYLQHNIELFNNELSQR